MGALTACSFIIPETFRDEGHKDNDEFFSGRTFDEP